MIDDPRSHSCDEYADNLAELALGILTGRERAATLAHVDSCPRCAEELEQLSHVSDAVVSIAPGVEPPLGFEVRLFNRMGVAEAEAAPPVTSIDAARRRPKGLGWLRASPRWTLAAAAVVIALVLGLSLGWSTGSGQPGSTQGEVTHPGGREVATAALTDAGRTVGRVSTYGGANPWMTVVLAGSSTDGTVTCEVVTNDGVTHKVGSFDAKDGHGAWGAHLWVAPQDVRKAEVVSSNGTVIATALLS
jgi:Putative zinc-finger